MVCRLTHESLLFWPLEYGRASDSLYRLPRSAVREVLVSGRGLLRHIAITGADSNVIELEVLWTHREHEAKFARLMDAEA